MLKILLDTDIGCDIDDMYALGYLLEHKDAEIVGITTVTPEPRMRAELCDFMCGICKKSIPICIGEASALGGRFAQGGVLKGQKALLSQYMCKTEFRTDAVTFMKEIIEANPREITLCAIGPLTNVAKLLSGFPHTAGLLRELVIMGGRYGEADTERWGENEWNIINDIDAARIVFEANVPSVRVLGVELTCRCGVSGEEAYRVFSGCPVLAPAACAARKWKDVYFHDAVAVASLFEDFVTHLERGNVTVTEKGETVFTASADGRHMLITEMDNRLFLDSLRRTVGADTI